MMKMETQKWRLRSSYRNGAIGLCLINLVTLLFWLQGHLSAPSSSQPNPVLLKHVKECEEIRRAMQPLELIKRVKEIEQEHYEDEEIEQETYEEQEIEKESYEEEIVEYKHTNNTAAFNLSKRLNNSKLNVSGPLKSNYKV